MAEILQKRTALPSGRFSDHYHGHCTFTATHRRYISSITSTSTHHLGSLQHPCHPHVANVIATNIKHSNENFFLHIFSIWINRVKSTRGLSRAVIINLPSICINTPMTTIYRGDYHGDLSSLNTGWGLHSLVWANLVGMVVLWGLARPRTLETLSSCPSWIGVLRSWSYPHPSWIVDFRVIKFEP